jgi:PAS domain S-box-containing protein
MKKIYTDGGYLHIPEIKSQRLHPQKDLWLSLHFYALTNEKGRVDRIVNLTEDITERKQTEAAIKENEEKYRTLWESSPDGLFILTDVFIDCNEQATRIWACQREDIIGHTPLDFSPKVQPDGRLSSESAKERISVALHGVPTTFYWQHMRRDGVLIDCEVSLKRITIGGKNMVQAIVRDITERKRAEEALREQERFLASVFASIQDGISVLDNALNVLRVNPTMEKWYSHNMPLVGKKCYEVYHGLKKPCDTCPSCRTIMEGESFNEVVPKVGRDGKQIGWLDLYSFPLIDMASGQLKGVIEYVRDITEQVSAQNALRESEERYRTIMEQSLVGATIIQNGRFVFANQAATTISGYSNNDIMVWSATDFLNFIHPEDRELVLTHLQKTDKIKDSSARFIYRFLHKSGRYIWIEIFIRSIHYQHGDAELGLFIDVTDRKQGEIARQKLLKELSQRNKEMEEFVYSISHDLKTPLATILGYLEMLESMQEVTLGETQRKYINRIEVAARRMVHLIDDLLLLSRAGKVYTPSELVNIGSIVDEVFNQLALKAKQHKVQFKRSPNMPELFTDRMRLSQVFTNLVDNAIKYSRSDAKPLVEVLYQEDVKEHLFTVRDNGIGIEPDYWNRIFEVFYRLTPDQHEGTGIGLALVRKIVESFGGRVWVESVLGEGSSFKFTIPK